MALILFYFFPVLLAFVFIPKSAESTTLVRTEGERSTVEDIVENDNDKIRKQGHTDNVIKRHKPHHRKTESDENIADRNSKTMDEVSALQDISDGTPVTTKETENVQDAEVDENTDGAEELTDDNVDDNGEDTGDDDAMSDDNDETNDNANEMDIEEVNVHTKSDEKGERTDNGSQKLETSCPKCTNKEKEKEVKIEMVKQHLLHKLGLSSAPKVGGPLPPLPFDFYVGEDFTLKDQEKNEKEEREKNVKTREIFIFGKDITDKCAKKRGTGCYSFNTTSSTIDPDLVSSIELWIYKQPDVNDHHIQEFMVSELEPYIKGGKEVLRFRNIVKRIDTRLKYGWMKIYVRRSVIRWLSKPHRNHGLAVVCKTCQRENHKTIYGNKEGYMPILVFYMKQHSRAHRRYRRHTQCIEGGSNCCHKETLEINFRDIGWDFIMTPDTIRPNFCTGSCNGIQAAFYNHTRLVQTLRQSVTHNFAAIQTCCSPVSFARPQSLLYRDHYSIVRKVDVPDLIVGECGCT